MITLKMAEHSVKAGVQAVEVWSGDVFLASIYPTQRGIKVISKYIVGNPEGAVEIERGKQPPIPAILINILE